MKKVIKLFLFSFLGVFFCLFYINKKYENIDVYENTYTKSFFDTQDYILSEQEIIQTIYSEKENLSSISFYLDPVEEIYSDYNFINAYITAELFDDNNNSIQQYSIQKVFFKDKKELIEFKVPLIENSKNRKYYLKLKLYKKNEKLYFKVLLNNKDKNNIMYENGEATNKSLIYTTGYKTGNNIIKYIKILIIYIIFIIIYVIFNKYTTLNLEKKYLILSIIISFAFLILTPLYLGNDELSHLYRINEIADGNIVTKNIDNWPGYYTLNEYESLKMLSIFNKNSYNYINTNKKTKLVDMQYMAVYSPLSYLPQCIAFKFISSITNYIVIWVYFTRLVQAIFCIVLIYFAIKIIPFAKKIVFLIGLLPITLKATCLLSTDGIILSFSLLFISKILQIIYEKKEIKRKDYIILGILALFVSITKLVYLPIILLMVLIPININKSDKKMWKNIIIIIIIAMLFIILWNSIALKSLVNGQGVNTLTLIQYYLKNPFEYFYININTFMIEIGNYISDLSGANNDWYGSVIRDASIVPIIFLILFIYNIYKQNNKLNRNSKIFVILVSIITYGMIATSLLLSCTSLYSDVIIGIQGRYFIPLLLPLFLITGKKCEEKTSDIKLVNIILILYLIYFVQYMV